MTHTRMSYSCFFLFDIELKFIEEDIIFILKGFTSRLFLCECDESKTSSRSSGVAQVHSYMLHLSEFTKKICVQDIFDAPNNRWRAARWNNFETLP